MSAPGAAETVLVGRINGVWGTQGWVKVFSFTEPATAIFGYQPLLLSGQDEVELLVEQWRQQGPRLVARLRGVETTDQAMALFEREIHIPRSSLPQPESGHYYWSDLVGLEVCNLEGHSYGRVQRILATGANDVLDVAAPGKDQGNVLIPYVKDRYVKSVDLAAGMITVDWPLEWLDKPDAKPD
jgi:16S rRNA processing protein RimM